METDTKTDGKGKVEGCVGCEKGWPMSHNGMPHCKSGSIASGGTQAHCTCDTCF